MFVAESEIDQLRQARHADPFSVLGPHPAADGRTWLRVFLPGAEVVEVLQDRATTATAELLTLQAQPDGAAAGGEGAGNVGGVAHADVEVDGVVDRHVDDSRAGRVGAARFALSRRHDDGFFEAALPAGDWRHYRLDVRWWGGGTSSVDDPYRFPPVLGDVDVWLMGEGTHLRPYEVLGATQRSLLGVAGTSFAVWAPNASRVSVVGDFNLWDGRRHPMRARRECGVWEIFIPGLDTGTLYKYEIRSRSGVVLPLKADPYALQSELRPATASVVARMPAPLPFAPERQRANALDAPVSIYEVHLGSWRRKVEQQNRFLTWDELADELLPYAQDMGFTHLELLPIGEHPFDGSWGYQPIGLYAPTARFGCAADEVAGQASTAGFRRFVDRCHAGGIGLILDWVPAHFPSDAHGLAQFDGTPLYEHADPREGFHHDWNTLIYNFGRTEVRNFLVANALYWLERYGVDGLRVDAVASMLYRDYSRQPGEWVPNVNGGRENLEAIGFLKRMNEVVGVERPQAVMLAEESTAFPAVSRPVYAGGLGFHYKWNMGWMHDTLAYIARDPVHRQHHHDEVTFSLVYAFDENFVLPISHDEVVHGKGSMLQKMPGDRWQRFANLRAYYGFMFGHPGKKLLFMGCEFAQDREWNHDRSLDWHLLADVSHQGVQQLVRDLNAFYGRTPALYQRDFDRSGFEWIDHDDAQRSLLSFVRRGDGADFVVVVCNFTPTVHRGFRVGVPAAGVYIEAVNTDALCYGGSGVVVPTPGGRLATQPIAWNGRAQCLEFDLPPLATVMFEWHLYLPAEARE